MVICEEEGSESKREEAKEKGAMVPMDSQWSRQSGSVFLQTNHSLSLTLLRDSQGVKLKLSQAPEITRNFMTFLPSGSQLKLSLELPQSTSLPTKKTSSKMLDWSNHTQTAANRSQIIRTLREVVKRAVTKFRLSASPTNLNEKANSDDVVEAVPVSFRPPQPTNMAMVMSPKKRVTTLLVGETLVSFELPKNCPFDPEDLEELVEVERTEAKALTTNGEIIYNVPRYTFFQRLQGWKMERRQRINGRFDLYYHHLPSRKAFRSITEVVNFFIYEVYPDKPQKSATKPNLGENQLPSEKREGKEKRVSPLKSKTEESKKTREQWRPIFYDANGDNKKTGDGRHIPMFDLNDEHQKEEENDNDNDNDNDDDRENHMNDVVGDNYYHDDQPYSQKETVEKFLAEAYQNLMNLPNNDAQKSKSCSFDINKEICEEDDEEKGKRANFFSPSDQTVEELLAEAYDNLINYPKTQPNLQKGKEKRPRPTEKRRRKKSKTLTPTSLPSSTNTPININSIPSEENQKEKITETVESMEVQKAASFANVEPKRLKIKEEVNTGDMIVDEKPSAAELAAAAAAAATEKTLGGSGGSCSSMEGEKSGAYLNMDECDLINHIPESSDMFDLAMFLANNRGSGGF